MNQSRISTTSSSGGYLQIVFEHSCISLFLRLSCCNKGCEKLLHLYSCRLYLLLSLFVERQFADLKFIENTERMILSLVRSYEGFEVSFLQNNVYEAYWSLVCDVIGAW